MTGPTPGHGTPHFRVPANANHAPAICRLWSLTPKHPETLNSDSVFRLNALEATRTCTPEPLEPITPNTRSRYSKVLPPPRRWSSKRCLGIVETEIAQSLLDGVQV